MAKKLKAFVVPHTHWDRAWYVPFEAFRARLVRLIDRVCHTLETDPDFACFCLDGQTVVLEDYLAIRPHMRERLGKLVRGKRLYAGPWYVLPDEYLVSPESLVRNLMLGHAMSAEFGQTMDVGHGPDTFGHIAQLPQILRGFGLDTLLFGRGLDTSRRDTKAEFRWRGLDGSSVLAMHMRNWYNNAAFLGYRIGWGDSENMVFDRRLALEQLRDACAGLEPHIVSRSLLLANGVDHSEHQPELPRILAAAGRMMPQCAFQIASFEDYVKSVKRDVKKKRMPTVDGELYYRYGDLLRGTESSRMYLKIANQRCQDLLERLAEPLGAFAWLSGSAAYPGDFLWYAWRELLKNHPHDDICGCSCDGVHLDMEHRFGVVQQVGELLVRDLVRAVARNIDTGAAEGIPIMLFNPAGSRRKGIVRFAVDLNPLDEPWRAFTLHDEHGREVPYDTLRCEDVAWVEVLKAFKARRHWVEARLDLPPAGYRTLYVRKGVPVKPKSEAAAGPRSYENRFYRMQIGDNGSVRLTNKRTGQRLQNLLLFEDMEDAGDVYNWSPLRKPARPITTANSRARIRRVTTGPFSATWRIEHRLSIPVSLDAARTSRSREMTAMLLVSEVSCNAASPRIDVVTRVLNTAKDHRLRVLFPTPIHTDEVCVDGHYAVIERAVAPPAHRKGMPPYPTQHQRRFVDVSDGKGGFAVINLGLPEFEAARKGGNVLLALTLFRGTGLLSANTLVTRPGHTGPPVETPGAQCLREMEFHYAFAAHSGGWPAVIHESEHHNLGIVATRGDITGGTDPRQIAFYAGNPFICGQPTRPVPREGRLPSNGSFVDVGTSEVVLSAVKKCEKRNSLIVRMYNPGSNPVKASLTCIQKVRKAYTTNLNEKREKELEVVDGSVPYACRPYQVLTLELLL